MRQALQRADLLAGADRAHSRSRAGDSDVGLCGGSGNSSGVWRIGRQDSSCRRQESPCNAGAGSGILELIASLLALRNGHLFPVLNFNEPDPMCPVRPARNCNDAAGPSFLNLNMFGRGLASCVAAGVFRG
jgi:hypothetical protein